ncbi:MAG TPA: tRNA (adenosine(37)-N6)-threonylcarbamoyltransferase complex ATPase subunit type 1 TsaE [Acidobacteriota bacterium]
MKQELREIREYRSLSEKETLELAQRLAESFLGHEVVLLVGELGAGKTVFAKGLAAGLGLEDAVQVCSPSYTLLNIYQGKHLIFHFDLYRLDKPADIEDLGLEDYLDRGVVIVEWAEKLHFPLEAIRVEISIGPVNVRTIRITR